MHAGPDELIIAAKIAVHHSDTGTQIALDIDKAEKALRAAVPSAKYIFLEPDLDRGRHTDPQAPGLDIDDSDAQGGPDSSRTGDQPAPIALNHADFAIHTRPAGCASMHQCGSLAY